MDSKHTPKLEMSEEDPLQKELTGVVAELAGILFGAKIGQPEDEYTDYLARKYSSGDATLEAPAGGNPVFRAGR